MKTLYKILIGAGGAVVAGTAAFLGFSREEKTRKAVVEAVMSGGTFKAHLTGYWPFAAVSAAEKKMEGGVFDRKMPAKYKNDPSSKEYKAHVLHTLEMHQKDPGTHPFVSVAGDYTIFPYGQRISIDKWPGVVFRIVDTGGHFFGAKKVYRVTGEEPLDICVESSKTKVSPHAVATIVVGDHFDKAGKEVAASKIKDQTIAGLGLLGAEDLTVKYGGQS